MMKSGVTRKSGTFRKF